MKTRSERLLPEGKPRYIRVYDNGGLSIDCYTVVFTGNYTSKTGGSHWYIAMNDYPFSPAGFCQHGEDEDIIDYPVYSHLEKKIKFDSLPKDCQRVVLMDYTYLWDITDHPLYDNRNLE